MQTPCEPSLLGQCEVTIQCLLRIWQSSPQRGGKASSRGGGGSILDYDDNSLMNNCTSRTALTSFSRRRCFPLLCLLLVPIIFSAGIAIGVSIGVHAASSGAGGLASLEDGSASSFFVSSWGLGGRKEASIGDGHLAINGSSRKGRGEDSDEFSRLGGLQLASDTSNTGAGGDRGGNEGGVMATGGRAGEESPLVMVSKKGSDGKVTRVLNLNKLRALLNGEMGDEQNVTIFDVVNHSPPPPRLPKRYLSLPSEKVNYALWHEMNNSTVWHTMNDSQLFAEAANQRLDPPLPPTANGEPGVRKIAFLFLTRGRLPLVAFWNKFLEGHANQYSVYIHTKPGFTYHEHALPEGFKQRQIPSQVVKWGGVSMLHAERRLLANALLDPANHRFVLVSEACIPLYNFSVVYDYYMNTDISFLETKDLNTTNGRGRYSKNFLPEITLQQWRKGSQWFELTRELALDVMRDRKYIRKFERFCSNATKCISDEHYIPTYLHMLKPQMVANRTTTYVVWAGAIHPVSFNGAVMSERVIDQLRRSNETCKWENRLDAPCTLFARKVLPSALGKLFKLSSYMGIGETTIS
eukprot:TRINITY_DN38354_c0_g1_i1.p1 TRINITY_DN38354_c0_g1~~TRINITY_DN38354_c0_g1_i1.p1  ORF type:complete len:579 (-),score=44.91 TRINITY_DN38354_c0_g1_i1:781-2517(-)